MEEFGSNLKSENIYLRKTEPEDLNFLYSLENNLDYWSVSENNAPYSKFDIKRYIENSNYDIFTIKELRMIICDLKTDLQIGTIDLFDYNPIDNRCGIGILVCKEYTKRGIATEALKIIKNYAFKKLMLKQLWCMINEDNIASISLFEKCDFHYSGTLLKWKKIYHGYSNVRVYQCFE